MATKTVSTITKLMMYIYADATKLFTVFAKLHSIVFRRRVADCYENNIQHDWKVWNHRCNLCDLFVHTGNIPHHTQV